MVEIGVCSCVCFAASHLDHVKVILIGENGIHLTVQLFESALNGVSCQCVIGVFTEEVVACTAKKFTVTTSVNHLQGRRCEAQTLLRNSGRMKSTGELFLKEPFFPNGTSEGVHVSRVVGGDGIQVDAAAALSVQVVALCT